MIRSDGKQKCTSSLRVQPPGSQRGLHQPDTSHGDAYGAQQQHGDLSVMSRDRRISCRERGYGQDSPVCPYLVPCILPMCDHPILHRLMQGHQPLLPQLWSFLRHLRSLARQPQ